MTEIVTPESKALAVKESISILFDSVPDAGGDGVDIALSLLTGSIDEMVNAANALAGDGNSLPDIEDWFDQPIRATQITKALTEFPAADAPTPYYLIIDFIDANGEEVKATTSALSVMIVLLRLHKDGALPATVTMTKAKKPTRQGFYPVNVSIHTVSTPVDVK